MSKLRVLVLPSSYFADSRTVGGGERYAFEYARALSRLTPTTLALFDTTPATEQSGELEVRTFRVRESRNRLFFPLSRRSLVEIGDFDVVHAMIFPAPLTDLLIAAARLRGQTVVLTDVGGGIPSISTFLGKVHPKLSLSRLAHGLALLSAHSARQFDDWRQPRVLLFGGAPEADGDRPPERVEPYALFVGRLLPHKGVLELIQAIDPNHSLRVVGRPYDVGYLEQLRAAAAGKRVTFHLDADESELERHYRGARLVLQVSVPVHEGPQDTSELLGLVALEGMSHGKPVVVTRAGSLPELLVDGATGFVVPPRDPAALRRAITTLMEDEDRAARMGSVARQHVTENFTWAQVAKRGLDFYRTLISG